MCLSGAPQMVKTGVRTPSEIASANSIEARLARFLELTLVPEVNFIRAGWELNRWGRVAPCRCLCWGCI